VVVNRTRDTFPMTNGCCIGRSGPAVFANLSIDVHTKLTEVQPRTGSQWVALHRDFCRYLLDPQGGLRWVTAFERRLVPDESFFQTAVMHSPFAASLVNHNMRWIDWPHQHGDATEYWQRLGLQKYVGGPRVLNSSEMKTVLTSPYMFARKVDLEVDPGVLQIWDAWMGRKLAGTQVLQAPIGNLPGDPYLKTAFRAPGVNASSHIDPIVWRRRRIRRVSFADGSSCGCGIDCGALTSRRSCCAANFCARDGMAYGGTRTCMSEEEANPVASLADGAPVEVTWVNHARHPVRLLVVDTWGVETPVRTFRRIGESAVFASRQHVVWRARFLDGGLLLQHVVSTSREAVELHECRPPAGHSWWKVASAM